MPDLKTILKNQNIFTVKNRIKLDDLLDVIVKTKNKELYIKRHFYDSDFKMINGHMYITEEKFIEILNLTKSREAKQILEKLNKNENDNDCTTIIDPKNNVFKFEGHAFTILYNKHDGSILAKAIDLTNYLDYENSAQAIRDNVDKDDVVEFGKISELFNNISQIQLKSQKSHTLFITESGIYSLILGSKKKEAKAFKKWVTSEVLPSVRKTGTYSTPKFYDTNMISNFDKKNVLYIGCIGIYDGEKLYKFGKSGDIYERDLYNHKKTFETFDIYHIAVCDNKDEVELKFKREMQARQLLRQITINGRKQTEIFTINDIDEAKYIMNFLINQHQLPAITEMKNKMDTIENINDKEVLIEREKTKQAEEITKQMEAIEKTKQMQLELEILKLKQSSNKTVVSEKKQHAVIKTKSSLNFIEPTNEYIKFVEKYLVHTNEKKDCIKWAQLKEQYEIWYSNNYHKQPPKTKETKKYFEEHVFKEQEGVIRINGTFRGWCGWKYKQDDEND